jgi:hypothetical protein
MIKTDWDAKTRLQNPQQEKKKNGKLLPDGIRCLIIGSS